MRANPSLEVVGLKEHLDATKDEHDGKAYFDFVTMVISPLNYSQTQIAIAFGVSRNTIRRWLEVYLKEQR